MNSTLIVFDAIFIKSVHSYYWTRVCATLTMDRLKFPDYVISYDYDLIEYAAVMNQTDALRTDIDHESTQPRVSSSKKWKHIFSHIWKGIKDDEVGAIQLIDNSGKGIFADIRIENGKLYLRKNGCCYRMRKSGDGLYFSPQSPFLPLGI